MEVAQARPWARLAHYSCSWQRGVRMFSTYQAPFGGISPNPWQLGHRQSPPDTRHSANLPLVDIFCVDPASIVHLGRPPWHVRCVTNCGAELQQSKFSWLIRQCPWPQSTPRT